MKTYPKSQHFMALLFWAPVHLYGWRKGANLIINNREACRIHG